MTDKKQPEALRLADRFADITDWWDFDARTWIPRTEAELRRLHEQNEALCAANEDTLNHFYTLMADHKKLHSLNQELLEALKAIARETCCAWTSGASGTRAYRIAQVAIAKAEGESK